MRPLPVSPTADGARLGARLRAARKAHGYTLEQLATAAGLTKGFLSRVERDETSLSVASLITICEVISINPGSLFSAPDVELVRRDSAPAINLGGTGVSEKLMTPRGQPRVQVVHTTAEPGAAGGPDLYTINCEIEVVYVIKGTVDLVFADRRERLTVGDALTLRGGEPHTWENPSASRGAEIVWVLTPAPWSGSA
ncbi:MAG: helix-turn-helix domain-containing protein [Angustibacter sp.]